MAKMLFSSLLIALAFCSISSGRVLEIPLSLNQRNSVVIANDFESGTTYPWFDSSPSDVNWLVEDFDSPLEPTPAPRPTSGSKYLRAFRGASGSSFGLAIFSSPYFTALPGDSIVLDFWIRSDHTGGNSLEVYYERNGVEERILNLGIFSSPSNFEWRTASAVLPITEATDLRLVIYGYCGGVLNDAIAIDNIVARRPEGPTTIAPATTSATTTVPQETTAVVTPTSDPTGCSYVVQAAIGQLKSPGYPDNYPSNSSCSWLIQLPAPYTKIKFDFVDFLSERCCDTLVIYDGPSEDSPVLLEHSGTFLPTPASVTSNVASVLMTFTSDNSIENRGFWIEYSGVF